MKKLYAVLTILTLLLALSACGKAAEPKAEQINKNEATAEKTEATDVPVETVDAPMTAVSEPKEETEDDMEPPQYTNITVAVKRNGVTEYEREANSDEDKLAAQEIVFDQMIRSAAWPGDDASKLQDCIILSFDLTGDAERKYFYQFDKDGKHMLQAGQNGIYTVMGDEAYEKLLRLAGIADEAEGKGEYMLISAAEAKKIMDVRGDIIILDVRTVEEFAQGHIPGAVLIPDYEIESRAVSELPDKAQLILVYCRTGRRSAAAAKKLLEMGYTNVRDFGGITTWPYETVSE